MKKLITAFLLLFFLFSCSANPISKTDNRISIVVTSFPLYDFVRAVADDRADIKMLIKPGAEVHSFDPSPADIIAIKNADLFFCIGGESDSWVDSMLSSIESSELKVIRLMEYVTPIYHEHSHNPDEHIWTSFENAGKMLDAICDAVSESDKENEELYITDKDAYKAEIMQIAGEIKQIVDQSAEKKIIVADRFPFIYFCEEFSLSYTVAFDACGSERDSSAGIVASLIDEVNALNVDVIYYTELSNHNIADIVSEQTGAEIMELHSCHNVTKEDFDNGETYCSLWRRNIEALRKGLIYECDS